MRSAFLLLLSLFILPLLLAPDAWAADGDGAGADRFFSEGKLLDAYSGYRHYLESDGEGNGPDRAGRFPERFEILSRLVDTNRVSRDMLYGVFRIGDHFARDIQRKVPNYKVDEICGREEFRKLGLGETQAPLLKEMVKAQLFLDDPEEVEKSRKDLDVSIIKKQSDSSRQEQAIPLEKLSVHGMLDGICLASMPTGECLVTVAEFNAYLPYADASTGESVAEARERLLKFYAFRKLKSLEGRQDIKQAEKEKIIRQAKEAQEYRRVREALAGLGFPVTDAASLSAAYQKHYQRYFAPRDSVSIQVLASSDSSRLDSIQKVLQKVLKNALEPASAKRGPVAHAKTRSEADSATPWMTFNEADLPREIVAPTDSFQVGQSSPIFRTPFGYVIAKLADVARIPGTPPEKAQTLLIYLATWDKYLGMDSVVMAKSKKFYDQHPDEFATPDTVAYDFWLAPRGKYRDIRMYLADTSRFRSMSKVGTDLPPAMTRKIKGSSIPPSLKLQMTETRFGQMLVKIKNVKKGGIHIPFARAKKEIIAKIATMPALAAIPSLAAAPADTAVSQEVLFTMGTENLVFASILEQSPDLSKAEIDAAIAAGQIQMNANDGQAKDDRYYEEARQKMRFHDIEKKHVAIQGELGKVVFNTRFYSAK